MQKFIALQDFDFSPNGVKIDSYRGDQVITTDDQNLIDVATQNGWMREQLDKDKEGGTQTVNHAAVPVPDTKPDEQKQDDKPAPRTKRAPEDKAVKQAPENK